MKKKNTAVLLTLIGQINIFTTRFSPRAPNSSNFSVAEHALITDIDKYLHLIIIVFVMLTNI